MSINLSDFKLEQSGIVAEGYLKLADLGCASCSSHEHTSMMYFGVYRRLLFF